MSILVVGSVALDTIKTPFGGRKEVLGGSATYFSVSARFFEPSVNLVAVIGEDFPARHIRFLKSRGIGIEGLKVERGKTFRWEGEYGWDFGDARTVATHLNVFGNFNPEIPEDYKKSGYVFLANIDPDLQDRVLKEVRRPRLIACDTMNYWIESKRKSLIRLLKKVDLFFLNESEARQLTGAASLVKAARGILGFGPRWVIIKKGEHGSLLFSRNSIFSTPAYLMESILDPTGAGDTFAGGVIGYIARCGNLSRANLRKAVIYGGVMASFAVSDFSLGRLGSIKRKDITKRFDEFRKLTRF